MSFEKGVLAFVKGVLAFMHELLKSTTPRINLQVSF
jgi:hypothetical protein